MNNFANWELTQLLPPKGDYIIITCYWYKRYSLVSFAEKSLDELVILPFEPLKNNNIIRTSITGELLSSEKAKQYVHYKHRYTGRVAWTWEDIRLYLKEKGFTVNIIYYKLQDTPYYCFIVTENDSIAIGYLNSYEEAREKAIKKCLTMIKNDSERIS